MATRRKSKRVRSARPPAKEQQRPKPRRRAALFVALGATAVLATLVFLRASGGLKSPGALEHSPAPIVVQTSIVLPTKPAARSVEELRQEADLAATQLVERYPRSPGALHIAATYYADLKQYDQASELWEQCIELAPQYAGPRVGLAMAAMERGNDARAVAVLQDASAAGCRTPELFQQLATALQKVGKLKEAEAAARQGTGAFPQDAALWISLGQIHLQRGKLEDAEASLQEGVRRSPDSADAHFALATVLARLGKKDQAAEHRRRFGELKEQHPLERHRFQVVYEAVLRRIVATTLCNAASEHQRQGQANEAERLYRQALELAPGNADAYRWLASFYREQGRLGDAHRVQHRLVQVEPERVENYINLASLSAQLGRMDEAENVLLTASQAAPNEAIVYRGLAGVYLQKGEVAQARAWAEKATRLEPSAEGYLLLATVCRQLGDAVGAEAADRAARRLAPDDPQIPSRSP